MPAGQTSCPESAARRVSFSELLGCLWAARIEPSLTRLRGECPLAVSHQRLAIPFRGQPVDIHVG
jgi:hypothetical protein